MRLVFMGTPDFALPSLEKLAKSDHQILSVVTSPDSRRGRGQHLAPPPVKETALRIGLPVLQPAKMRDPYFLDALRKMGPDLLVVVAFKILPPEVLAIPEKGAINLHASLLPKYRGAAPINWAIVNGEKETGVTTFLLDIGVDTGAIILQRTVKIGDDETAGELHDRLKIIGAKVLLETVDLLASSRATFVPQSSEGVSKAPKLRKGDGQIDWSKDAEAIRNLIRGMNPFPGAFTLWRGRNLKVHQAKVVSSDREGVPGQILRSDPKEGVSVATGRGALLLTEVQLEGKRKMTSAEFVQGQDISAGEILGQMTDSR